MPTRPTKEGGATTYQGKVGLGFPDILASEMDADLDTIYAAWNGGVTTANIGDGSITTAKLAPNLQTWQTGAGNPITPIDGTKVVTIPGDPTTLASLVLGAATAKGRVQAWSIGASGTGLFFNRNWQTNAQDDATKPSWGLQLPGGVDSFMLQRSPAGSTTQANLLTLDNAGNLTITGKLNGGAASGTPLSVTVPAAFSTTVYNTPVNVVTSGSITTRGGKVLILSGTSLAYNCVAATKNNCYYQWVRNPGNVVVAGSSYSFAVAGTAPLPDTPTLDSPPAGTYTYTLQVSLAGGSSPSMTASGWGNTSWIVEVG